MKNHNPMSGFIHGEKKIDIQGDCKDISKTGFAFCSKDALRINTVITADIKTNGLPLPPIKVTGKVIRCTKLEDGNYEVAVQANI